MLSRRMMLVGQSGEWDYELYPEDPDEEGAGRIRCKWVPATEGVPITICYYATKAQGYIYDGRKCGASYLGWPSNSAFPGVTGIEAVVSAVPKTDGNLIVAGYSGAFGGAPSTEGEYSNAIGDIPYCKYIKIKIGG